MSIIEIRGGPITHTYLIRKYNKSELAYEVLDHIRAAEEYRKEIVGLKQRLQQVVQTECNHDYIGLHGHPAAYECSKCGNLLKATHDDL